MTSILIAADSALDLPRGDTVRILALAAGLSDAGFSVRLATPAVVPRLHGLEDLYAKIDLVSWRNKSQQSGHKSRLRHKLAFFRWIAHQDAGIVQIETSLDSGFARLAGVKDYAVDVHGLLFSEVLFNRGRFNLKQPPDILRLMERFGVLGAQTVIAVSEDMANYVVEHWGVERERTTISRSGYLPNRVRVAHRERQTIRERDLLFVGNLSRWASVDMILTAADQMVHQDPNVSFEIIGDGADRSRLEGIRNKHGLTNVTFHGYLPPAETMKRMASAGLLLAPLHDTLALRVASPIKLIEYAALGRPIVTNPVGELPRLLSAHGAAFVAAGNDAQSFVEAIADALQARTRWSSIGANAQAFAREMSWTHQARVLATRYEDLGRR